MKRRIAIDIDGALDEHCGTCARLYQQQHPPCAHCDQFDAFLTRDPRGSDWRRLQRCIEAEIPRREMPTEVEVEAKVARDRMERDFRNLTFNASRMTEDSVARVSNATLKLATSWLRKAIEEGKG